MKPSPVGTAEVLTQTPKPSVGMTQRKNATRKKALKKKCWSIPLAERRSIPQRRNYARQAHLKTGISRHRDQVDRSMMFSHDAQRGIQTEPGSFSHSLGGKEW